MTRAVEVDRAGEGVRTRRQALPLNCPPRGLNREEAAEYVGVGVSKFDELVRDRLMPAPKAIGRRNVWHRLELDKAFDALPSEDDANPWNGGNRLDANPWDDAI